MVRLHLCGLVGPTVLIIIALTVAYCDMASLTQITCEVRVSYRCATRTVSENHNRQAKLIVRTKLDKPIIVYALGEQSIVPR